METESAKTSAAENLANQLKHWVRQQEAGAQMAGEQNKRIPSIRKIAGDYNTSVTTAMYALRILEDEKIINRRPNGIAFINSDHTENKNTQKQLQQINAHKKQIAVTGPIGPRIDYAWKDQWGIRIMLAAEHALLDNSNYFPVRVGVYGPDWPEAMAQIGEQIKSMAGNFAGVIIPGANTKYHHHLFNVCDKLDLPWVCINRPDHKDMNNFVSLDYQLCGQIAGLAFQQRSSERVLVLTNNVSSVSAGEKIFGLMKAYWDAGLQTNHIHILSCKDYLQNTGYNALQKYLQNNKAPAAIFTTGDFLATGAMRACQSAGLTVPDDVSVLSSTGLDIAEYTTPPLATVSQPMRKMGETAAALLLEMIKTGRRRISGKMIAPTFSPRQSLGLTEAQIKQITDKLDIALGDADETTNALDDQLTQNVGQVLTCQNEIQETITAG